MAAESPTPAVVQAELATLGRERDVTAIRPLAGGVIAGVWLVSYADGARAVAKTVSGAPGDLFELEAAGLAALGESGHVQTPAVLAVTGRLLLLEALPPRDDTESAWAALAAGLAALHRSTVHDRFGWEHGNYLGRLPQSNRWTASGHDFFAEQRLLRYLGEPPAQQALTRADRRALERLCGRLAEIIPEMPPVLTHGDLWAANVLGGTHGHLAVIDPAVSYTWAEVDLSMLWGCPRPPESERFFDVYQELNPSPPGWAERMPILLLRETLSTIAHFGAQENAIRHLREVLAPFYPRPRSSR